ncbi:MAG: helix-hairpin-helix domain-containing protein [Bacteroidota bacterium]
MEMKANVVLSTDIDFNDLPKNNISKSVVKASPGISSVKSDKKEGKFGLRFSTRSKRNIYKVVPFDINKSDTTVLKKVRGIGSVLSNRIVKYRDLLGGFVDHAQLQEVYGLKDSVIMALDTLAIIEEEYKPKTIEINSVDEWQLARHPYLNKRQAKAILNYKNQHGNFNSVKDLSNIKLLDSTTISRLSPYMEY